MFRPDPTQSSVTAMKNALVALWFALDEEVVQVHATQLSVVWSLWLSRGEVILKFDFCNILAKYT